MATTLASQVALAVDNVRLFDEIQGQRARLAEILDSTSDGILLIRQDGIVESANRRATEMLGGESLVDRPLAEVVPGANGGRTEGDVVLGGGTRVLQLLRQVLLNLVANAIEYTPSPGTVTIAIGRRGATLA
jgi:signal transduction histidine kinase